jgi:hypothetical protein
MTVVGENPPQVLGGDRIVVDHQDSRALGHAGRHCTALLQNVTVAGFILDYSKIRASSATYLDAKGGADGTHRWILEHEVAAARSPAGQLLAQRARHP